MSHESRRRLSSAKYTAAYIGVPLTTLYNWIQDEKIGGVIRVGRRVLFDLDKLDAWIDAGGTARRDEAA